MPKRTDISSILVIGAGPSGIGHAWGRDRFGKHGAQQGAGLPMEHTGGKKSTQQPIRG